MQGGSSVESSRGAIPFARAPAAGDRVSWASTGFFHIWTHSRPGAHTKRPSGARCSVPPRSRPPQTDAYDAIPTRARDMENPHAERQNVLIQRIIKNAVCSWLPSMQPFLISRFRRINARKPFLSSTVVSRRVPHLLAAFDLPRFYPPSADAFHRVAFRRKSSKRTRT